MKYFILVFLLLNTIYLQAIDVKNTIDWKEFLSRHDLVWKSTPTNYFNAPFVGNGLLGAMLYQPDGQMLRLDIGSNEVLECRNTEARSIVDNGRLPIGYFEFASNYSITKATGRLDIYNAEVDFNLNMYKNQTTQLNLRVLRHIDLVVLDYKSSDLSNGYWMFRPLPSVVPRKQPITGNNHLNPSPILSSIEGVNLCVQKRDAGGDYVTAWKEIALPNGWKRLLITVKDDYPNSTDSRKIVDLLNEYSNEKKMATAYKEHKAWWNNYYTRSFVSIPHSQMESLYWGLQYKLASMMRKGSPICDLMGPWYKETSWPGVWMNLNTQMLFSSLHISNQQELASTLKDYIHSKEQDLINSVPEKYRYNSAGLVRCTGREQIDSVYTWPNAEFPERSNLIYLMYYMWEHYRMTMDDKYLQEQFYPLLKRAANFLLNVLEEDDAGKFHTPKAHSPESINGKNTNYDLSSLRWGCKTLLEINKRLKLGDKERQKWEDVLKRLVPYPVDQNGYMAASGKTAPQMHRHWCHLFQIYPYYLVNFDQAENHDIILRSLKHWGKPNIPNTWTQAVISSMYSSMQMGDKALEHLNYALATQNLSANFMHAEGGSPCSETYGGLSRMLLDMLIQSWGNKIRIFPGVSKTWQDAVFYRLRAEGGFLVSAKRKNGSTEWIEIESLAGEPCVIQHGFNEKFKVEKTKIKTIDNQHCQLFLKKGEKAFLYIENADKSLTPITVPGNKYNFYGWPDRRE